MRMARHVEELASRTPGKEALAIESFARALRQIPTIIADNGGYDSSQLVSELRAMHSQDLVYSGLNMVTGEVRHFTLYSGHVQYITTPQVHYQNHACRQ